MARLTKKQAGTLLRCLSHAQAANDYIMSDRVAVCSRGNNNATTTLHYARKDGNTMYEVNKDCGSPFCRLDTAIEALKDFIDAN